MFKSTLLSLALLFSCAPLSLAQQAPQQRPPNVPPAAQPAATPAPAPVPDEPPVVTKHEIRLDERTIKYTVTTGILTRHERWASPLFLVGESYGTTRASGLSGLLVDRGIAFNGVLLISTIMNFQTARFAPGNDLPLILILPSYTATAWYHKKLPADLQRQPLRKVLDEAEKWAINEYQIALSKGDRLTGQERQDVH